MPNPIRRLWPLGLYRVSGRSMMPAYGPGDTLVGWRWVRPASLRRGTVVVARYEGRPIVKRLAVVTPSGRLELRGDNPDASTDSRHFGPLPPESIEARILFRAP